MSSTRLTMATASSLVPYSSADADEEVCISNAIAANAANKRTMAGLHEQTAARAQWATQFNDYLFEKSAISPCKSMASVMSPGAEITPNKQPNIKNQGKGV